MKRILGFQKYTMSLAASIMLSSFAYAGLDSHSVAPDCLSGTGALLQIDNNAAIDLKSSLPNGAGSRAHVEGPITKIFGQGSGHTHFEITLGQAAADKLEVVYNTGFGDLPSLKLGMQVEACGDFINSYAPENGYQASPDGALIHWIHRSNSSHPSGFIIIDGTLYGQGSGQRNFKDQGHRKNYDYSQDL